MLFHAVQKYIGFGDEGTTALMFFLIGGSTYTAFVFALILVGVFTDRKPRSSAGYGLQGVPPADQYVVPDSGGPECGSMNCEMRGCAIIGSCQGPKR